MKHLTLVLLILTIVASLHTSAYAQREGAKQRDILVNETTQLGLNEILITDDSWIDIPNYYDRSFWNEIPDKMRNEYIENAEAYLEFEWSATKATDYLEIIRSGTRVQDSRARNALEALVRGELVEGDGRFIDQIVNGVWYHCEQTWWGWSAHLYHGEAPDGLPDPDEHLLDLGVGEVAQMLSWTHYFFEEEFNKIHPLIARRLKDEIMRKAVNPYFERDLFYWWWMGFEDEHGSHHVNNWVPWIHYNILSSILLLEDDPERKIKGVQKVLRGLDVFMNSYPDDGGCDEGPGYWGAAVGNLYRSLALLKMATGGRLDVFDNPLVQNMGSYIYRVHIAGPYSLNFADAGPTSGGGRGPLLYRFGKALNDPLMQKLGAFRVRNSNWGKTSGGNFDESMLESALDEEFRLEILTAPAEEPLLKTFWLPQTGIGGAREEAGTAKGFYFAAKGGSNNESHNHNDVGSFMLYVDGEPLLVDVGSDTYVAETFRAGRYEIWNLQSQYHNVPKINGKDQLAGNEYKAKNTEFTDDGQRAMFATDITDAYPEEAGVKSWVRRYIFDRSRDFVVSDHYQFEDVRKAPTTLNFMTSAKVSESEAGIVALEGDGFSVEMDYDESKASAEIEILDLENVSNRLDRTWPDGLTRIVLTLTSPDRTGQITTSFTRIN